MAVLLEAKPIVYVIGDSLRKILNSVNLSESLIASRMKPTAGVTGIGSTILVDRTGVIRHVLPGALEFEGLVELLRGKIREKTPAEQTAFR